MHEVTWTETEHFGERFLRGEALVNNERWVVMAPMRLIPHEGLVEDCKAEFERRLRKAIKESTNAQATENKHAELQEEATGTAGRCMSAMFVPD